MNETVTPKSNSVQASNEVSLFDLLQVVADNIKLLTVGPLAVGTTALAISFAIPPTYTAETKFLPPQQQQSMAAGMLSSLGALGGLAHPAQRLLEVVGADRAGPVTAEQDRGPLGLPSVAIDPEPGDRMPSRRDGADQDAVDLLVGGRVLGQRGRLALDGRNLVLAGPAGPECLGGPSTGRAGRLAVGVRDDDPALAAGRLGAVLGQ